LRTDNAEASIDAAIQGLGIARLFSYCRWLPGREIPATTVAALPCPTDRAREEAQVDFGQDALTLHRNGKYRCPYLFCMTLQLASYCRSIASSQSLTLCSAAG